MTLRKCLDLQKRAKQKIPGMSQLLSKRPDMFSLGVWPGYYKEAKGAEVWDLDGNHYIDMSIAGIGANVLGYADPDVNKAVVSAVSRGSSCSLNAPEEVELAELLCELHPWAGKVRFARSGGESMTVAVRIARAFTKKDKIAFCGYHGWHDWYLSANIGTANALGEHLIPGLNPLGVPAALQGTAIPFRYNDLQDLERILAVHKNEFAAIVMEPVRSVEPQKGFLEGVRKIADKNDLVLIFDEISSGLRLITGGAHMKYGVHPDIAVFSKALGNGFPIAAVIGRDVVMQAAEDTFISSTMWTERIGPVAALATLRKHKRLNVGAHLLHMGQLVQEGWKRSAQSHGLKIHVSGIYPLSHFQFDDENALSLKAYFIQSMLEKGFLATNLYYPMWAHKIKHVRLYGAAVDKTFAEIKKILAHGTIHHVLKGKPSGSGFKRIT